MYFHVVKLDNQKYELIKIGKIEYQNCTNENGRLKLHLTKIKDQIFKHK